MVPLDTPLATPLISETITVSHKLWAVVADSVSLTSATVTSLVIEAAEFREK